MHIEGADELKRAMKKVGDRTSGLALRNAVEKGATVLKDEAVLRAPRKTGNLRDNIEVQAKRIQVGRVMYDIGVTAKAWYARFIEKGTKYIAAKPFLRPTLDTKKEDATKAVEDELRRSLKDVLE